MTSAASKQQASAAMSSTSLLPSSAPPHLASGLSINPPETKESNIVDLTSGGVASTNDPAFLKYAHVIDTIKQPFAERVALVGIALRGFLNAFEKHVKDPVTGMEDFQKARLFVSRRMYFPSNEELQTTVPKGMGVWEWIAMVNDCIMYIYMVSDQYLKFKFDLNVWQQQGAGFVDHLFGVILNSLFYNTADNNVRHAYRHGESKSRAVWNERHETRLVDGLFTAHKAKLTHSGQHPELGACEIQQNEDDDHSEDDIDKTNRFSLNVFSDAAKSLDNRELIIHNVLYTGSYWCINGGMLSLDNKLVLVTLADESVPINLTTCADLRKVWQAAFAHYALFLRLEDMAKKVTDLIKQRGSGIVLDPEDTPQKSKPQKDDQDPSGGSGKGRAGKGPKTARSLNGIDPSARTSAQGAGGNYNTSQSALAVYEPLLKQALEAGNKSAVGMSTLADGRPIAIKLVADDKLASAERIALQRFADNEYVVDLVKEFPVTYGNNNIATAFALSRLNPLPSIISLNTHISLFRQCLLALSSIHAAQISHCDISTNNIMLDPATQSIRIIDWGLSIPFGHVMPSGRGTPPFAPNDPTRQADHACDIYALAKIAMQLLARCIPCGKECVLARWHGLDPAALSSEVKRSECMCKPTVQALAEVLVRMCSEDPCERPAADTVLADVPSV